MVRPFLQRELQPSCSEITNGSHCKVLGCQQKQGDHSVCCKSLDKDKIIQASSDGPSVNLLFHNILGENRADLALKVLTYWHMWAAYHTQVIRTWCEWFILGYKKILSLMYKIFDESPSRRADYEKINSSTEVEYPEKFCAHRWVENELVATCALVVWPKVLEVVIFCQNNQGKVI